MNIVGQYPEIRTYQNGRVEAIRFVLEGGITGAEIQQLKQDNPGYDGVLEHHLTLFVPPVDVEEVVAEKEAVQALLTTVAEALPDELAVNFVNLYGELVGDGKEVPAGQRRVFEGELYAANVTVWDRPDQWPDQQPGLWRKITKTGEIEDWVQPSGAHDAYHFGDVRAHVGKVWRSTVEDGPNGEAKNTWEPGVYGWEEVRE